jgi:hypothetical protein
VTAKGDAFSLSRVVFQAWSAGGGINLNNFAKFIMRNSFMDSNSGFYGSAINMKAGCYGVMFSSRLINGKGSAAGNLNVDTNNALTVFCSTISTYTGAITQYPTCSTSAPTRAPTRVSPESQSFLDLKNQLHHL